MTSISVIGGGAWGTALAQVYASAGHPVTLWAREADVVSSINTAHENTPFLPNVPLHTNILATGDLSAAARADYILIVTPAQYLRASLLDMIPHLKPTSTLVICSKGIEIETGMLLSDIAGEIAPNNPVAILTGPTFAAEIARGLPTAVTLAMRDKAQADKVAQDLNTRTFRLYPSDDMVGAQIGGAVKNVMAIACGMIEGRKLGESARAALVTRGLAEIARLAISMGAKKETLMGMCGVGDLLLTCSSMQSRNFSLGRAVGEGRTLNDVLSSRTSVTEGVYTARALAAMAKKMDVDMPIAAAVHEGLSNGTPIDTLVMQMLERPVRAEDV